MNDFLMLLLNLSSPSATTIKLRHNILTRFSFEKAKEKFWFNYKVDA